MYKLIGFAVPRAGYGFTGAGATVEILDSMTGGSATLYEDDEVTTKTNPLTADSTGKYEGKLKDGVYDITIAYSGGATVTHTQVRCFDTLFKKMLNGSAASAAKGDIVYQSGTDGTFTRAASTTMTVDTIRALGIVLSTSVASGARGWVNFSRGTRLEGVGSGWTPGALIYTTPAGVMTQTKPVGLSAVLGYAASTTDLVFDPQDPTSEATATSTWPFDRNVIINSAFDVMQRTAAAATTITDGLYILDRWRYQTVGGQVCTGGQDSSVPTVADSGIATRHSAFNIVVTPNAAPSAGHYHTITQRITGDRWRLVNGQAFTISFWVKATVVGSYPVAVQNAAKTYSCVRRFTVSTANTWEKKTVYFPAQPGAVAPTLDESHAMTLVFAMMTGTTFQTATSNDGVWVNADVIGQTGDANALSTAAYTYNLAQVQLEPGATATSYQQRTFDEELALCQRYYWKTFPYGTTVAQNCGSNQGAITYRPAVAGVSTTNSQHVQFPVVMRAAPTVTTFSPGAASANWYNSTDGAASGAASVIGTTGEKSVTLANAQAAGDGLGEILTLHLTCEAEL